MRWKLVFLAPVVLLAFALFIALGGFVVQLLWNWLMPAIFGWPALTFWQALGLLALCRILFGGFSARGGPGSRVRRRMAEKWEHLPPEKRARLRRCLGERFGGGAAAGAGDAQ